VARTCSLAGSNLKGYLTPSRWRKKPPRTFGQSCLSSTPIRGGGLTFSTVGRHTRHPKATAFGPGRLSCCRSSDRPPPPHRLFSPRGYGGSPDHRSPCLFGGCTISTQLLIVLLKKLLRWLYIRSSSVVYFTRWQWCQPCLEDP